MLYLVKSLAFVALLSSAVSGMQRPWYALVDPRDNADLKLQEEQTLQTWELPTTWEDLQHASGVPTWWEATSKIVYNGANGIPTLLNMVREFNLNQLDWRDNFRYRFGRNLPTIREMRECYLAENRPNVTKRDIIPFLRKRFIDNRDERDFLLNHLMQETEPTTTVYFGDTGVARQPLRTMQETFRNIQLDIHTSAIEEHHHALRMFVIYKLTELFRFNRTIADQVDRDSTTVDELHGYIWEVYGKDVRNCPATARDHVWQYGQEWTGYKYRNA